MARSVFANGRNFSHKGSGDKAASGPPDVCKTPVGSSTPPIPYVVSSKAGDLSGATSSVSIDGNPTAIASSVHTACTGDQAGAAKGIASGTTGSKTHFTSYSFDVKAEGEGVVRHLDTTTMNSRNTIGINLGAASPSGDIKDEELGMHLLRFEFVDELGQPIKNVPYKAVPKGKKEALNEADGRSADNGRTSFVSTTKGESIDCYLVWENFSVRPNKPF